MPTNVDLSLNSKLEVFFHTALREIYWSEQHLVNVLQSMKNAATSSELKSSFEEHERQTVTHVTRIEQAFEQLGLTPEVKHSRGLQGLFDEGWQVIDETEEGSAQRDVALIIAAQKVEHYEIACYGSLVTLARTLGNDQVADLLASTLQEEKQTDQLLTEIAESGINKEASEEPVDSISGSEPSNNTGGEFPGDNELAANETLASSTAG